MALTRRGFPEPAVAAVLERFTDVGLIDDAEFALAWVETRHAGRGLGRRALRAELARKGIDPELAAAAVDRIQPEDEERAARELVRRRAARMSGLDPATRTRRLAGLLARRGIPDPVARRVLRQVLGDPGD